MAKKLQILVLMLINFTGIILSFECGDDKWFVMADCPSFFPGYSTSFLNMPANSIYNCVLKAKKEPTASSLVFHRDSQTCYLYEDIASSCQDSVTGDFGLNKYLFKPFKCQNGGILSDDKLRCSCPDGYFGPSCSELATDCQDLRTRGILNRVKYPINLIPNRPPIILKCFYGRTIVMHQNINNDVYLNFNRSWAEYRDGFHGTDNFWVGLEIMNFLTSVKFLNTLVISAKMIGPVTNNEEYLEATFNHFNIDKENTQFVMTYKDTSFIGYYLGELLKPLNNSRFSTYDSDNDNMAINCAMKYGGGWWYNTSGTFTRGFGNSDLQYECAPANPTGYFWNQCEHCTSEVKDISTGQVVNGVITEVEMVLME